MNISEYKKILKNPLRPRTLVFLTKNNQVLLGYKKQGFGQGKWLGIGGKVDKGESIEHAAIRELKEEIGAKPLNIRRVATLNFYFPEMSDETWNQQVCVFITDAWEGEPEESEEIRPQWFPVNKVPYSQMWDDAHYWLPRVLKGETLLGEFTFGKDLMVIDSHFSSLKFIHSPEGLL